jgi:hypothetical protein
LLDIQGQKVSPGATFTLLMSPDRYFNPGTEWEGEIVPLSKKDVLIVPTAALLRHGDAVYLPVKVSTGLTTQGLTQIIGGAEEKRPILVLDDSQLGSVPRHAQQIDEAALRKRANEQRESQGEEPMPDDPQPRGVDGKKGKHADYLDDDRYGEDPYGEL